MITRRHLLASALAATALPALAAEPQFRRVPFQYIAALGPASATEGDNAHLWGHWPEDPGPIGVWLRDFDSLRANGGAAPAGWQFDSGDWWLDENGLLMKAPVFPMPHGRYLVTNAVDQVGMLEIDAPGADGKQHWRLGDRTLGSVTHQKCRSARYRPEVAGADCSPANAPRDAFPLPPGMDPPPVADCERQVYAVPIIFAVEDQAS